jgi:ABC-type multidrug transport system permease subunit
MSVVNPFTYAVHAYRVLLLQQAGIGAIATDLGALALTCVITLGCATLLFRRAL